jgi:hypothetical protein
MRWVDGTVYKGEWKDGHQHGKGKLIQPDGTVLEGYFRKNVFLGTAPLEPDGIIEEVIEEN